MTNLIYLFLSSLLAASISAMCLTKMFSCLDKNPMKSRKISERRESTPVWTVRLKSICLLGVKQRVQERKKALKKVIKSWENFVLSTVCLKLYVKLLHRNSCDYIRHQTRYFGLVRTIFHLTWVLNTPSHLRKWERTKQKQTY